MSKRRPHRRERTNVSDGAKRARIEKEFGTKSERIDYGRQRAIMVAKQRARAR